MSMTCFEDRGDGVRVIKGIEWAGTLMEIRGAVLCARAAMVKPIKITN